jgi:hypothetical protein
LQRHLPEHSRAQSFRVSWVLRYFTDFQVAELPEQDCQKKSYANKNQKKTFSLEINLL